MSPTALSPVAKMGQPQRTASQDSASENMRKRVCKACDRCRLKKSKCDGSSPCSRCKADNAICVFGERKKSHDKVYPKGYVEMLEQQQSQLVAGLQEMYKRLQAASAWSGATLSESNGHPLTHDILSALNLLEVKHDGSGEHEAFEEDCQKLKTKLYESGVGPTLRRGSFSSESEHSQHGHARSDSHGTPVLTKPFLFKDSFNFGNSALSPSSQSSVPRSQPSFSSANSPPPLQHDSPLSNDPQFYQAEWAYPEAKNVNLLRSNMALQTPELGNGLGELDVDTLQQWNDVSPNFDMSFTPFSQFPGSLGGMPKMMEPVGMNPLDPMEVEFNNFIQVS